MSDYPTNLPLPNLEVQGGVQPTVVRTEFETGVPRQRRRFTEAVEVVSVRFTFSPAQFAIFEQFWKTNLEMGTIWFSMQLRKHEALQTYQCRFQFGDYGYSRQDNLVIVSATLDIKEL